MLHESKFARWIRSGGHSEFVVRLGPVFELEKKFRVVPDRLLESILDDALGIAVARLNAFLPEGTSIDIAAVDVSHIRKELAEEIAGRLGEIGVPVNPNDPVISSILARYAERLNARFQTQGLRLEKYTWRSRDDARVRALHAGYDDRVFSWAEPPEGGHPGEAYNCRCTAEPILDLAAVPDGATCDIITGARLARLFPDAPAARLDAIAREIDLQIVTGRLNSPERLAHFFGQVRQETGADASLEESLNYPAARLLTVFSYFRRSREEADQYGRTDNHPANQEAIANRAYANRNGNGDVASGDGWRYRGRGLKQLTGRANYRAFTQSHADMFGEEIDFEANPDLLAIPRYAVRSALFFWVEHKLYAIADRGMTRGIADAIKGVINPGTDDDSLRQRWEHARDQFAAGTFTNVCSFSVGRPRFEDQ